MVDFDSRLNSFRVNRDSRLDLPTPESPISTTVSVCVCVCVCVCACVSVHEQDCYDHACTCMCVHVSYTRLLSLLPCNLGARLT